MPTALEINTAAAGEPFTLDGLKDHLRVDIAEDDGVLESKAKAARAWVEAFTGRQLMKVTYDYHLDDWPDPADCAIEFPVTPLLSVSQIDYVDGDGNTQTLATTVYTVDTSTEPGRVYLAPDQSWPSVRGQRKAITITFVAGYNAGTVAQQQAAVPNELLEGLYLKTEALYDDNAEALKAAEMVLWPWRLGWVA